MTATESRAREGARTPQPSGAVPGLPQVNLLPPEVRAARGLKSTKRLLVLVLVAVLLLCGGGYVLSSFAERSAQDELADADAVTAELQTEAQQYAEVPQVLGEIDRVTGARAYGMAPDVEWSQYVSAVVVLLPPGTFVEAFTMTLGNPVEASSAEGDPLQPADSVGRLEVVGRMTTLPDTASWMDALGQVPGFTDPRVSSALTAEDDGKTFYRVTVSVQVTPKAFSGRYAADAQQEEG